MAPIIHFQCRHCETELSVPTTAPSTFPCLKCGQPVAMRISDSVRAGGAVDQCAVCGHEHLYVQKDFNRNLGLVVILMGIAASVFLFNRRNPLGAMLVLGVTALIDAGLYCLVGDVAVCYVCHAIYRSFPRNPSHHPFELMDLEKFGGRPPRF